MFFNKRNSDLIKGEEMEITEITERIIGKAKLTPQEAMVARVEFNLSTAGKRTKNWVKNLSQVKRNELSITAQGKIHKLLKAKGAGN